MKPTDFLTELSNEKLSQYKTAAAADASKADKAGDFKKGDKRFSGIVKATNKQFDNDSKKPKNESYTVEDEQIDGMAQGEIREIIKNAIHIKNQLDRGVSLDGWMYSYVTTSNDHLNSVAEQINNPNIDEQGVAEAGITGSSRSAEAIAKQKEWNSSSASDSKQDTKTFSYQGYTINFTPDKLNIYLGGDLVFSRKGDFANPTKKQLVAARANIGKIIDDKRREALIRSVIQKNKGIQGVAEEWSQKYKSSINCSHPKGFSQKAHCAGKKKHNESIEMEMTCPDCGMCQTHGDNSKDKLDELKCWSGFHRVAGTKAGFPGSCAKNKTNEELDIEEDRENFNGINLLLQKDDEEVFVKASAGSRELGHVLFVMDGDYLMPQDLEVEEKYRGQGIAQTMYDFVKSKGYKIRRSGQQTDAGAGFWAKHRPEQNVWEEKHSESCPHCGGEMVSEELMNEKKDACYYKVKSRYKVWPSAYASGALVKCRKKGADSWGNGGKKNESSILEGIESVDESLHDWFNKEKWVRMDTKGNIKGPCAKEPGEGKPKCLPQAKAHSLGKKGRASAASRKRREDPNPDRSGKAINVNTKKEK